MDEPFVYGAFMNKILLAILFTSRIFSLTAQSLELPLALNPDMVVKHAYYTLEYSEAHKTALWTAYELTAEEVLGTVSRKNNYRADPLVPGGTANENDYRGSGFDHGHLAPAADMKISDTAMSESFYMSNMVPQRPEFNRGIWLKLENAVRIWATENEAILIVSGPIYKENLAKIGTTGISIPSGFFKVILDYREPQLKAIGFLFANEGSNLPLTDFAVSIDDVERATGFDFFYQLSDDIEEQLESSFDIGQWNFTKHSNRVRTATSAPQPLEAPSGRYWINTKSNTRHNEDCRYYNNTAEGHYTDDENEGTPCGICGG
ncbi:MAG: hypothetical protein B0D92_06870 [Spirochaeta sp. LUC14_002_19_P3]|nr:MAG: hypothetical protein B0D92_06870 [Spirochaeta sp. LUC14_002_19_P3]